MSTHNEQGSRRGYSWIGTTANCLEDEEVADEECADDEFATADDEERLFVLGELDEGDVVTPKAAGTGRT